MSLRKEGNGGSPGWTWGKAGGATDLGSRSKLKQPSQCLLTQPHPVVFFPWSARVVNSSYFLPPCLLAVNSLFLNLGFIFIITGPVWGNEMLNGTWAFGYEMFRK